MEQYLLVQRIGLGYRVDFRRRDVTAGSRGGGRRWCRQLHGGLTDFNVIELRFNVPFDTN